MNTATVSGNKAKIFCYAAHSLEEFERMCVRAIQEPPGWASQRRREHGENAAWSQRSAQVSRILNTAGLLSKK